MFSRTQYHNDLANYVLDIVPTLHCRWYASPFVNDLNDLTLVSHSWVVIAHPPLGVWLNYGCDTGGACSLGIDSQNSGWILLGPTLPFFMTTDSMLSPLKATFRRFCPKIWKSRFAWFYIIAYDCVLCDPRMRDITWWPLTCFFFWACKLQGCDYWVSTGGSTFLENESSSHDSDH